MRAVWKGTVTFGLVSLPVELRPAVREQRLSFRLLHEPDAMPIRYERVRDDTGEPVPWDEIVKGYEVAKGDYVVLNDEDFDEAALAQSHTVDIHDFVDPREIDPRFLETSFFLTPARGGERAYALLREALKEADMVGIGRIILQRRQHLVAIRAEDDALVMLFLRFATELIPVSELSFPSADEVRPPEVRMAVQVIRTLRRPFEPEKYVDEYEVNLRKMIRARARGQRVALPEPVAARREPRVLDLMSRLRASLEGQPRGASGRSSGTEPGGPRGRTPRTRIRSRRAPRRPTA
ncbi:MAG TPA: Ku protein [Gemmatimonadaceae bacterium]|nr:Ku protein [Gemmatimonadaceae bacterium]